MRDLWDRWCLCFRRWPPIEWSSCVKSMVLRRRSRLPELWSSSPKSAWHAWAWRPPGSRLFDRTTSKRTSKQYTRATSAPPRITTSRWVTSATCVALTCRSTQPWPGHRHPALICRWLVRGPGCAAQSRARFGNTSASWTRWGAIGRRSPF